jgi:hypothetical protein
MRTTRFYLARIFFLIVFVSSHCSLSGCSDDSKTTGTLVERSEADKAHMKSKIESYKGGPPKAKGKSAKKS